MNEERFTGLDKDLQGFEKMKSEIMKWPL